MDGGWIYVFMSGSDIDRFKVGKTKNNPFLRLNQLRTGDPTLAFQVAYFIPQELNISLGELESAIHQSLTIGTKRIEFYDNTRSEWFYGDARNAWMELDMILEEFGFIVTDYYQPFEKKVVRFWEESLETLYRPGLPLDENGNPIF